MSSSSSRDNSSEDKDKKSSFKKNKLLLNKTKPSNLKNSKKNHKSNSPTKTSKKKKQTKNSKFNKLLYEVNIQRNIQLLKQNDFNVNNEQLGSKEKKDKLLIYFQGKKIYIEIYNGNENASGVFCELLLKYKIIQCKRLSKNIDYIIFKEGHLKTKRYAVMNNIKMVNPLWVDDKINRNIFKDDKEYLVKTNMGDILLEEKFGKDDKGKVFDHEIEAEFDENYANMIDQEREKELKEKEISKIKREKRKSKNPRNRNQIKFFTEEEAKNNDKTDKEQINNKNKNDNLNKENNEKIEKNNNIDQSSIPMDIDMKEEKKESEEKKEQENIENNENGKNNLKGLKKDENIENSENKNNPSDDEIIEVETEKKNIFQVITDTIHNEIQTNNENDNLIDLTAKKGKKFKSKTPFKIRIKTKYKKKIDTKLKSKDYKHKATFKKIMVTNIDETPIHNPENLAKIQGLIKTDEDDFKIKKEKDDIEYNTPYLINKDKEEENNNETKNATIGQKINIITYKLEEKEIHCLRNMDKFEYKGDLTNPLLDYGILYSSASVIILDKEKSRYDWQMYDFFFDKKLLVDFASFLFEFITENADLEKIDAKETLDKLTKISMNEETYFLNKKIRYKQRSLINSLNIIENITEIKKEEKDEDKKEAGINFVLNYNILSGEKRIIQRILKFYLKANVLKINLKQFRELRDKRSKSVGPNIKFNFKVKKAQIEEKIKKIKDNKNSKNNKFESIIKTRNQTLKTEEKFKKNNLTKNGKNKNNIKNINKNGKLDIIEEIPLKSIKNKDSETEVLSIVDKDLSKEEKIDFSKIKGDTYLLSKEKVNNINLLNKIPNFKGVINYKYAFDSFWAGKLLDLKDEHILKKYEFK